MHADSHPPALFSVVRIASLISSLFVALGSGTNYVFSAYGPQLSARLHLSHTQLNAIALAGNIGVYATAPFWGKLVDAKGPRILLALGFVTLIAGYSGIRYLYDKGLPEGVTNSSIWSFSALIFCAFITGIGGNGGLVSALNATAKSFPDRARATTTGLVISGFGLSAFLFSTIAHAVFPGDTSSFLLILAIGTSLPFIPGFFLVRPIPLPTSELHPEDGRSYEYEPVLQNDEHHSYPNDEERVGRSRIFDRANESHVGLLEQEGLDAFYGDEMMETEGYQHPPLSSHTATTSVEFHLPPSPSPDGSPIPTPRRGSLPLSPSRGSGSRHRARGSASTSERTGSSGGNNSRVKGNGNVGSAPNMTGMALASSKMFWILFTMMSLLSGTGLMYINNVGSISQALYAHNNPEYDEVASAQIQALQVSTVSIMNCLGRIIIGLIADFTKNYLHLPRSFCISLVCTIFIISQLSVYITEDTDHLWKASALLGLAYGSLFGLFPTMVIEWFGLPHFSQNWGFLSISPMIGGNIFSFAFGRNLDAHAPIITHNDTITYNSTSPSPSTSLSSYLPLASNATQPHARSPGPSEGSLYHALFHRAGGGGGIPEDRTHQCLAGRSCYVDSLKITIAACALALGLALYAGWKDYREMKASRKRGLNARVGGDVRSAEDDRAREWEDER